MANEFPVAYLEAIDEVLAGATYAGKYHVNGAEFTNGRQVKVPYIDFGEAPEPVAYDRFKTESNTSKTYKLYELDHDVQKVFYSDAADVIDKAAFDMTQQISEWQRLIFEPYIDKDFFKVVTAKSFNVDETYEPVTLSAANIKQEIRKVRTQFTAAGLRGGDLYLTSEALGYLEDATDRGWSNETTITDTVGSYDGFTLYEAPSDIIQCDFTAISGGLNTVRYITKRSAAYLFAPGSHQRGDGWLAQMRWIFGSIVRENKRPGIYTCNPSAHALG